MRNTLITNQKGFSLVELAISMIVIGVLLVPALHGYSLFLEQEKKEETNAAVDSVDRALSNYVSLYGRYPCPARPNEVLGNVDYGREATSAPGVCEATGGITRVVGANATNGGNVLIGAVPFRALTLPHELAYDGNNNQLTYAVSEALTNDATFNNALGEIEILDGAGNPTLLNDATGETAIAHFAILSHGDNGIGARGREGGASGNCAAGTALEQENCDDDAVFRVARGGGESFDDVISFTTTDSVKEWQISAADEQNIHLRRTNNFAIGVAADESTAGFATAEVSLALPDDAVVLVENSGIAPGAAKADTICTTGGANCFRPDLIAGQFAEGESLECPPPGQPTRIYLVGIQNGAPICTDQLEFNCPAGEFATGFDTNGNLICDTEPPLSCADQMIATTCGPDRNVTAFFNGGTYYGTAFSGECHRIRTLDTDDIEDIVDSYDPTDPNFYDPGEGFDQAMQEIRDELDIYNNEIRTTQACGTNGTDALIRDTFQCVNGSWNTSPVRTIEKIENSEDFSGMGPLYNGGYHAAETNGLNYNSASPMSADGDNNDSNHDCWCREDYRLRTTGCSGGLAGQRFMIERHICPQTRHDWGRVYPTSGTWDTSFCGCQASSGPEQQTCSSYFGYSGNGISGFVDFTRTTSCSGSTPTTTDSGHDASNCYCPSRSDNIRTVNCPAGTTNSFTYDGQSYTGKAEIYESVWTCPTGTPGSAPVSSAGDAGYYASETLVHTEPCTCNSSLTQDYHEDCPAGYTGAGIDWELPYNCATSSYDAPSDSNKVAEDCHLCIWQAGTPRSPGETFSYGAEYEVGETCPACSGTGSCYEVVGPSEFEIWDGCYCAGQ